MTHIHNCPACLGLVAAVLVLPYSRWFLLDSLGQWQVLLYESWQAFWPPKAKGRADKQRLPFSRFWVELIFLPALYVVKLLITYFVRCFRCGLHSSGIHNAILYALIWGRCAGKFVITVSGLNRLVYTIAFQFMYMYIIYGQCGMHVSVISAFCKHLFRLKKGKYFQSHLLCGWEYFCLVFNWHCPALIVKFS